MRLLLTTAALAAATLPLASQQYTSPKGYLKTEPNSYYYSYHGYYGNARAYNQSFVKVDNTHKGTPIPGIKALSWRRTNRYSDNTQFIARKIDFEVLMGHADWSKVQHYNSNAIAGLLTSPATTVFTKKKLSLPDWQKKPTSGTAPFDMIAVLDTPFSYDGKNALFIQTNGGSSDQAKNLGYPTSRLYTQPFGYDGQTYAGSGCKATGQTSNFLLYSYLYTYTSRAPSWQITASRGPKSTPLAVGLGTKNPMLDLGLCEKLMTNLDVVVLPMGASDSNGNRTIFINGLTYNPNYVGSKFYLQAFGPDAGQKGLPVALSRGTSSTFADMPKLPIEVAEGVYTTTSTTPPKSIFLYKSTGVITGIVNQ